MNLNQSAKICAIAIVLVAILGGVLRVIIAQQDLLWLDELHTAWVTSGSFGDVFSRAGQGNQSPLFFCLVWPFVQVLGETTLAVRTLSIGCGISLLLLSSLLAWKWTQSVIATSLVAWLIAIDPWFVFYSTEARPYVLLELLGIIQVLIFWNLLSKFYVDDELSLSIERRPKWIGAAVAITLTSTAMFYCHYTCIWLFVAEIIFFVMYSLWVKTVSGRSYLMGRSCLAFLCVAIGVAVCCVPAVLHLLEVFHQRGNWAPVSSSRELIRTVRWPFLLSMVLPIVCTTIFYFPNKEAIDAKLFDLIPTQRNLFKIPFVVLWAIIPIACCLLLDHFRIAPIALYRYTVVGAVAFPLFAGLCTGLSGKWYGQLAIALILMGSSFVDRYEGGQLFPNPFAGQLAATQTLPLLRLENWRDPINEINLRKDKNTHPVFLFGNVIEDIHAFATEEPEFLDYLRFPIQGFDRIDASARQTIACPTIFLQHFRPTDIELIRRQGGCWLLIRGDQILVTEISNEFRRLAKQLAEIKKEEADGGSDDGVDEKGEEQDSDGSSKSNKELAAEAENVSGDESEDGAQESAGKETTATEKPKTTTESDETPEPTIQFAQFPASNVYLITIDW